MHVYDIMTCLHKDSNIHNLTCLSLRFTKVFSDWSRLTPAVTSQVIIHSGDYPHARSIIYIISRLILET